MLGVGIWDARAIFVIVKLEHTVMLIIKYMQKFQRADWLRARQLIPNSAES